jgi:hypothetical protein
VDGAFEVREIFGDGGRQDGVCSVEVPVCEMVAHPGDLSPWDGRLGGQQVIWERFNGLTDLQQADPDGVEYQAVGQVAALQVERIASMAASMSASRWRSR